MAPGDRRRCQGHGLRPRCAGGCGALAGGSAWRPAVPGGGAGSRSRGRGVV